MTCSKYRNLWFSSLALVLALAAGCQGESGSAALPGTDSRELSPDFRAYWFAGEAEITSYDLKQARYGEMREGHAVLIYVTEPFRTDLQVKADNPGADNLTVLKLNRSKNFLTGIYPYSIMSSIFQPVSRKSQALKVSTSVQEWCGHVYTQLNNRDQFEINSHSYFESEGDRHMTLAKSLLEDEIWTQIRLEPESLPTGSLKIIPSLEYLRLTHQEIKAYQAVGRLSGSGSWQTYSLEYPELGRRLDIRFETSFPHRIEGWDETYPSGFGPEAKPLTSTAVRKRTLKTPYWQKNQNKDVILRDSLGL